MKMDENGMFDKFDILKMECLIAWQPLVIQ